MKKSEKGFIALMSTIIIGAVLLVSIVGGSLIGLYSRYNVLDFELKERSFATADACVDHALLELSYDASYGGGDILSLNSLDSCRIGTMYQNKPTAGQTSFAVQATSSDAVTNLSVVVDTSDLSIQSWSEIATF